METKWWGTNITPGKVSLLDWNLTKLIQFSKTHLLGMFVLWIALNSGNTKMERNWFSFPGIYKLMRESVKQNFIMNVMLVTCQTCSRDTHKLGDLKKNKGNIILLKALKNTLGTVNWLTTWKWVQGLLSSKDKGKAKELKKWCKFWGHQMFKMAESQGSLTGEGCVGRGTK